MPSLNVLLSTDEMSTADRLAAAAGVPTLTLMENAGRAIAAEAARMAPAGALVVVLCGPGNNGGDGYVAARLLAGIGYETVVVSCAPHSALRGDAAVMAGRWAGSVLGSAARLNGSKPALVVDALFGAGLARPLDGLAADLVAWANTGIAPVLAVDVPSGVDGTTGAIVGQLAVRAARTITFFRRKTGHLLMPGRELCGPVVLAGIGIPAGVLDGIAPRCAAIDEDFVRSVVTGPMPDAHKYKRGHAIVVSGPAHRTGAARLGARGALRIGAGLVTVASPPGAVAANAAHLTAIMLEPFDGPRGLAGVLADPRRNAILIGPGAGVGTATRILTQVALEHDAACVLDADALTSATIDQDDDDEPIVDHLFTQIREKPERPVVLTPHEGEFRRVFGQLPGSRLDRARAAAARSGAVVVLKGPDTVIAEPGGRAFINGNAPPTLATAGSGDVLAGFVTGLLAQGLPALEASAAAVWLHGACAGAAGPGLVAEDLADALPRVLAHLARSCQSI
jgi:NAD(P)H-hydrate epimerase